MLAYSCCIQPRVRFASANLEVACAAILWNPLCLLFSLLMLVVQVAWIVTWVLGVAGE
jgi:hypothetical protein